MAAEAGRGEIKGYHRVGPMRHRGRNNISNIVWVNSRLKPKMGKRRSGRKSASENTPCVCVCACVEVVRRGAHRFIAFNEIALFAD